MLKLIFSAKTKLIFTLYKQFLTRLLQKYKISFTLVSLPTKRRRLSVLKSPHVHKKAKEHFNLFIYKFFILLPNNIKLSKLLLLNRPSVIRLKIKKY